MTPSALLLVVASVAGGIDQGRTSPNNGAGIAGFVLLLTWIAVAVIQVLRHRRRRRRDAASNDSLPDSEPDAAVDDDITNIGHT